MVIDYSYPLVSKGLLDRDANQRAKTKQWEKFKEFKLRKYEDFNPDDFFKFGHFLLDNGLKSSVLYVNFAFHIGCIKGGLKPHVDWSFAMKRVYRVINKLNFHEPHKANPLDISNLMKNNDRFSTSVLLLCVTLGCRPVALNSMNTSTVQKLYKNNKMYRFKDLRYNR